MIAEIQKQYTKEAVLNAEKYDNIYDSFDDLIAKLDLVSMLKIDDIESINYGLYLYIESLKSHVKGLEFQLKREIIEGTLEV